MQRNNRRNIIKEDSSESEIDSEFLSIDCSSESEECSEYSNYSQSGTKEKQKDGSKIKL